MFEKKCTNGGNHHKFKARYTTKAPEGFWDRVKNIKGNVKEEIYEQHYICDVCVWCGEIVKVKT